MPTDGIHAMVESIAPANKGYGNSHLTTAFDICGETLRRHGAPFLAETVGARAAQGCGKNWGGGCEHQIFRFFFPSQRTLPASTKGITNEILPYCAGAVPGKPGTASLHPASGHPYRPGERSTGLPSAPPGGSGLLPSTETGTRLEKLELADTMAGQHPRPLRH